ncbi:MAG: hypothetical protein HGB10_08390 [Coriobacteriia bacterium]|nr:hypothetical protein [Coriobacteriia bacterium]
MGTNRGRSLWMIAALVCVLLIAGVATGCKPSETDQKKAMLESVAKWYVAQGALDMAAFKAGIYDPDDILGVATMTAAPPGAVKTEVSYAWAGDSIMMTVPSEGSTLTLTASPNQANVVLLKDAAGSNGTFVMKDVDGVWKIDVAATQELQAAETSATAAPEEEPASTETTKKP